MKILKEKFDGKDIILLTNGKRFSNFDFTKKFIEIGLKNIIPCISLHSDIDKIHDEIVGVKGSYKLTIKGIYNLAKFICPIEIRYVINKLNYSRLYYFAEFSYRNFPFVFHFAFMELEVTGNAVENYEQIWIDPYDYKGTKVIMVVSETNVNSISEKTPLYLEHSSIIFQNQNDNVIAWHTSHYSHSSHYSHESHYSHYSHCSGR